MRSGARDGELRDGGPGTRARRRMLALAAGGVGLVLDMSLGLGLEVMMPRPAPASDTAAAAEASPMGVVRALVEQALAILRDGSAPTAERQQQLRELIAPVFDFTTMSRFALGYHWRDLTPEQRREFTDVFARFVQDSYLSRINEYSGQDVTFGKVMSESADYAQVHTRIVERGKPPTAVNYRLERVDGVWRIYDVTVDNLSILANYRNQFSRVMNKQGYAALVSDLRKKQRHLGSSLGEARAE